MSALGLTYRREVDSIVAARLPKLFPLKKEMEVSMRVGDES
jgi:hypothetical protein